MHATQCSHDRFYTCTANIEEKGILYAIATSLKDDFRGPGRTSHAKFILSILPNVNLDYVIEMRYFLASEPCYTNRTNSQNLLPCKVTY